MFSLADLPKVRVPHFEEPEIHVVPLPTGEKNLQTNKVTPTKKYQKIHLKVMKLVIGVIYHPEL